MGRRKWFAAGGAVAIAALMLVLASGAVFAQGATPSPAATPATSGPVQSFIDQLAKNLGISTDKLQDALKTTAEQQIDAAVSAGKLTEKQGSALKQRIDSGKVGGLRGLLSLFEHHAGARARLRHNVVDDIATAIGVTPDQLHSELSGGKTLKDVIAEHGKTVKDVVDAVVNDAKTGLDAGVASGKLTAAQETQILDHLRTRVTDVINNNTLGTHAPRHAAPSATPATGTGG